MFVVVKVFLQEYSKREGVMVYSDNITTRTVMQGRVC